MRKRIFSLVAILSGLFLWGCYPDGPEYTEDLDIVLTHHNPDYNFSSKSTYAMPDRIVKITGNLEEGESPELIPEEISDQVLSWIASNMESLGWERVATDASPDIILTPVEWESTTIYYYYDYWYWYWGGYYPYWGWGYPPVYYGGSYTTGTLMMTMMDPTDVGGNGNPIHEWTGILNGLLYDRFDANRVKTLIDKAFDQSPYLKTTN